MPQSLVVFRLQSRQSRAVASGGFGGTDVAGNVRKQRDVLSDLALVFVLAIWVGSFLVFKLAFRQFHPHAFNLARFALMIPLAFITLRLSEGDLRLPRAQVWPCFLSGLLGFGIYQVLFISGLAQTQASNTALLISMAAVFSAILLTLLRIEGLSRRQWLGIVASFVGVASFLSDGLDFRSLGVRTGDLMVLGASACFAAYGVLNKRILQNISPVRLMAYGLLFGIVPIIMVSVPDVVRQDWSAIDLTGWLLLAYATIFPVYLAYLLWNWAIARQGVARTTPVAYLIPVFTGLVAWIFLDERLSLLQIASGALVILGVALARSSPPRVPEIEA